jgi:ubiquinone/menaquinone biosynthesis C-methylase UbiE
VAEQKSEQEHAFRDVDASGVAPELVRYLDEVAARPEVRALHDAAHAMLAPQPGENVLEVGCGLGADAREIARAVAPAGRVTAVDVSDAMLAAARERHDEALDVTYERADVTGLPYADGTFDAVRIERVLQHVPDTARACAEMARVLKPGGRVLALDTDWGSLAVDLADTALAERCLAHTTQRFVQPRAGLTLRRLLATAGLPAVETKAFAFSYTSLAEAAVLLPMLNDQIPVEADFVPRADRDAWFAALEQADRDGTFVAGWTGYVVLARKP